MEPIVLSGVYNCISVSHRRLVIDNKFDGFHEEYEAYRCPYDLIVLDSPRGILTFEAARLCSKTGIGIVLLNWNGNLLSSFLPKDTISAKLKMQQYKKAIDNKSKHTIASAFVDAKINKSIELLLKLADFYPILNKDEIRSVFANMENSFKHSNELLTREGNASIIYFKYMKLLYNSVAPQFPFENRNGRSRSWSSSASDPINAMENFSYAIAEVQVRRALNAMGFDMSIGYLHDLLNGRDSLVYDCVELLRWLCDLSVLQLLEEGLKPSDFITTENYFVRLRPETARRLVEKVKINFNTRSDYKNRNYTLQNIFYDNLRILADYITEKKSTIVFNIPEIQVRRNDDTVLRDRIVNMSTSEANKLGLARNTLFYMKKNIQNGKKIKVYNKVMNKIVG